MKFENFIGPSYHLQNTSFDRQRTVNWIPEVSESGSSKGAQISQFVPRPGLKKILIDFPAPRGIFQASTNVLYGVFGDALYKFVTDSPDPYNWTFTVVSNISIIGGTDRVGMTDNGYTLFITAGGQVYTYTWNSYAVPQATPDVPNLSGGSNIIQGFMNPKANPIAYPANAPPSAPPDPYGNYVLATSPIFLDSRVIFLKPGTQGFFWTELASPEAYGSSFASAESDPEAATGLISHNQEIWVFGRRTIEVWYDSGSSANLVFARRGNTILSVGCNAPYSISKYGPSLTWLAGDVQGGPVVYTANGYTPQRISTYALEQELAGYSITQLDAASAYSMQIDGHQLYVLNVPGASTTWVYDATTSQALQKPMWHEWQSDPGTGVQGRFLGEQHVFHKGKHVIMHPINGTLFVLDRNYYKDDENRIMRERTSPYMTDENKRVFFKSLTLDFATGDR
jgi:hypothetical protein